MCSIVPIDPNATQWHAYGPRWVYTWDASLGEYKFSLKETCNDCGGRPHGEA